jgi:predicted O-linked N-acetylglucosamine transferase (SPINDLY family)
LPDGAIVYCCLNGMQKLTADIFQAWMIILSQVPNSVLWLLSGTSETNARLQQIAERNGIAPGRLVFAEKKPNPEHLARYPLADLFLDTHPYGAHTTAADAMWMGVPVLTIPGRSFASRVCASLVRAAGFDELVSPNEDAYIARAVELGRAPALMAETKRRLKAARGACVLFDTPRLVRHLEDLYRQMWKDFKSGSLPEPNLTNLDIYCDVGLELNLEARGHLADEAYRLRYEEKLALWRQAYAFGPDSRFWVASN